MLHTYNLIRLHNHLSETDVIFLFAARMLSPYRMRCPGYNAREDRVYGFRIWFSALFALFFGSNFSRQAGRLRYFLRLRRRRRPTSRAASFSGKSGAVQNRKSPKKAKAVSIARNGLHKFGSVLLSQGQILSTIAAERLNFRVRNGNGWNPLAIATEKWVLMVAG